MHGRTFLSFILFLLVVLPLSAKTKKKKAPTKLESPVSTLSDNDQKVFDYFFNEALNARQQNRYDEAFDLFQFCIAVDSLNAQPWFEIAVFYTNMKRQDLGLEALEKAHSLDTNNDWYAYGLAKMYIGLKMFDKAIALYENLLLNHSEDEDLHYYLALLYTQEKRPLDALNELEKIEKLIGKNEQISIEKFKLYKELGKPKRAIHEIQELVNANPYDVEIQILLGDCWMELAAPKEALKVYENAKKMDPNNPAVTLTFANYYNAQGDSVKAKNQFLLALKNPDIDVETKLYILTPILVESMETADSVHIPALFSMLLEQHPNSFDLRKLHVEYLMGKGRKEEAKSELKTALDLNPQQLDTWKMLLDLSAEANNQAEIRSICSNGVVYFPNEPIFWFYLGLSHYPEEDVKTQLPELKTALGYFQKAAQVCKDSDFTFLSRIYGIMGDISLSLKETAIAYNYYDKALLANPANVLVLNNYAYYLSEEGLDLPKAERMSRKTIDADPQNATFLDTYAWIFFKEEKYGLAKIYIERAVKAVGLSNAVILEHYGDILWFNGEKEAALEQWKKALELENPTPELLEKVENGKYVKPQIKKND